MCRTALKAWTTALLSWTSLTPNFVIRNFAPAISLATDATLLADDRREGELTSGRPGAVYD